MEHKSKANILLFLTAFIWGTAFIAQKIVMDYMDPFFFNFLRFGLGGFFLIPVLLIVKKIKLRKNSLLSRPYADFKTVFIGGLIGGVLLFIGSALQQIGLIYTTAGKSGFITGLYIVIVPIIGIFLGKKTHKNILIGIFFAVIGLYLLSVKKNFFLSYGDFLTCISTFFWAIHIHIVNYFSPKTNPIRFACFQFLTCSILNLIVALFFKTIDISIISKAWLPILYTGILSVGIAYTMQVIAQKDAEPSSAAIILSFETVFALIGSFIILGEVLNFKEIAGCVLMFCGIVFSQRK